jgi:serine/threonine protein kinase
MFSYGFLRELESRSEPTFAVPLGGCKSSETLLVKKRNLTSRLCEPSVVDEVSARETGLFLSMQGLSCIPRVRFYYNDEVTEYIGLILPEKGDLMSFLERERTLSINTAMIICTRLVEAVETIHSAGYVHRDLRPDTIYFGRTGSVQFTDLRMSHRAIDRVQNDVDVVDYMAPEVLVDPGPYTNSVDLWSIGIILYEMLYGGPPFSDVTRDRNKTIYRIINSQKYLWFPEADCIESQYAQNLIRSLLQPSTRRSSLSEVKRHAFFSSIDWNHTPDVDIPCQRSPNESTIFRMRIRD